MASLGRRKSYFEFMRESIISGIKEYRPMKSKHCNAVPLAYLVKLWMEKTNPNRIRCQWLGGSAGMSLKDVEKGLQVLRRRRDMSETVLSRQETADWVARTLGILRTATPLCQPVHMAGGGKELRAFGLVLGGMRQAHICAPISIPAVPPDFSKT